ncbi:hypothetical protein [Magnetococcus sp. PR-3]|uniref:hypothetical protein n=1 Tax=Magnetococcus sp. PR-3 TaxID=3120355 RepID=UPI002FCDE574
MHAKPQQHPACPSQQQLRRALFQALIMATLLLLLWVLPTAYRLDPTGLGQNWV